MIQQGFRAGRPIGAYKWTQEHWYLKYHEATRNLSYPHSLAKIAAHLGISQPTARKYYGHWGPPPANYDGWELHAALDDIRKVVVLSIQVPGTNHAIAQLVLTYPQTRQLLEKLADLNRNLTWKNH